MPSPARMEIPTYGGKTDYAKRDLYASERILEAARDAYDRLGGPNPHRLLRPTRTGAPYRENNWLRIVWKPALRRAELEGIGLTPHGLRHSRLSLMAKSAKVTPGDLRRFAGTTTSPSHSPATAITSPAPRSGLRSTSLADVGRSWNTQERISRIRLGSGVVPRRP
jgi:hypothetical protein